MTASGGVEFATAKEKASQLCSLPSPKPTFARKLSSIYWRINSSHSEYVRVCSSSDSNLAESGLYYDGMAANKVTVAHRLGSPPEAKDYFEPLGWGLSGSFSFWRTSLKLRIDRKSTRLNSSHPSISYAVFCLK